MLLELKNISKIYQSPSGSETRTVLDDLSFEVNAGESIAILGPSGSGKSTLLNIIGSLDKPTTGQVILDGENLSDLDQNNLAKIRNKKIGFIFQLHHVPNIPFIAIHQFNVCAISRKWSVARFFVVKSRKTRSTASSDKPRTSEVFL